MTIALTAEDLAPADHADNFRVQVGRYGERWYTDPLPACDIAPASDAVWPSVSTVKKAAGGDWSFVALRRCAEEITANPHRYEGLDVEQLYAAMKNMNSDGLNKAAQRGTSVHWMCEQMLATGRITDMSVAPEYRAAVEAFFDTYQPERRVVEAVAIHRDLNGVGYGGTGDAGLVIDGRLVKVDWKSRGADSKHGAYAEEAAQIAAYARAQYIIELGHEGHAVRAHVPAYEEGWVVSIKPDGFKVYPVDLDKAWQHFTALHLWWVARRDERAAIGRQLAARAPKPKAAAPAQPATRRDAVVARIRTLREVNPQVLRWVADNWPDGVPTLDTKALYDRAQFAAIEAVLEQAERASEAPFPVPPAEDAVAPVVPSWVQPPERPAAVEPRTFDEGAEIDADTVALMLARLGELDGDARAWVLSMLRQAKDAGVPVSLRATPTMRQFETTRGLLAWSGLADDDLCRAGLVYVLGDDRVQPGHPLGAVIGALDIDEAVRFANVPHVIEAGSLVYVVDAQGERLEPAAN